MTDLWPLFEGSEDGPNVVIDNVPDGTRIVVVSDAQVPLEDQRLLRTIFEDFVPWYAPSYEDATTTKSVSKTTRLRKAGLLPEYHLFLNGDIIDNFTLSKYLARVNPRFTLGDEVEMTRGYLESWRKDFSHTHYIFGNHEDRWEREIYAGNRHFAFATKSLAEVLGLRELGYDYVPYLRHYDFMGFTITHGDITQQHASAAMLRNYMSSGVSGHTNRPQSFTWASASNGEPATWYSQGMTCRRDIGDIIKDWRRIHPWQQGFLIGEVSGGVLYPELVRVHHERFSAAGKIFSVR